MKLAKITVMNLLGARHVELETHRTVQLVAGRNRQGKSSIVNAVRLALSKDYGRVSQKKDLPELITDGADNAVAQVIDANGDEFTFTIMRSGRVKDSNAGRDLDPRLPFVLDAQRIAKLSATERRTFMAGLLGLSFDDKEVVRLLLARGLDEGRVKRLVPLLKAGCDEAMASAKERASQARGRWNEVTGEKYGSVKAETWAATIPPFDPAELESMQAALASTEQTLGEAQQALGALVQRQKAAGDRARDVALLRQAAELLERRRAKLATDEAELASWQTKLSETEAAAGDSPREGLIHDLANLVADAVFEAAERRQDAERALEAYEALHGPIDADAGDPEARERLPGIRSTVSMLERTVANSRRDVGTSEDAAKQLAALEKDAQAAPDPAEVQAAREQVQALEGLKLTRSKRVRELLDAKVVVDSAAERTTRAREAHQDAAAWDAIATALSPDGVQAELLTRALAPLNERLGQSAADLGWPAVEVRPDMAITMGGRAYHLLSESEQWRVDAMLAEAASHLSGWRLLLLDRFDVLDADDRPALLAWLDVLAKHGEVDTAIVCGTLRAIPGDLPDSFDSHWIADGYCGAVPIPQAA